MVPWTSARLQQWTLDQIHRYPRPLWLLASANLVLFTARGMVLPFLVIFFGQVVGLGEGLVGAGLAVAATCGVVFTLVLAGTIDRFGARPVLIATVAGLGLAYLAFAWGTTPGRFLALMILFGLFSNLYWPASDALATSFLPPARAGEIFALLRVANATGIGAGGLIGGVLVSGGGLPEYRQLYLLSGGLVFLAAGLILVLVRSPGRVARAAREDAPALFGWREVMRDRWFILSQVVLFILVTAFTQIQVSVPPYLRESADIREGMIGALFAVNTLIVILAQVPVRSSTLRMALRRHLRACRCRLGTQLRAVRAQSLAQRAGITGRDRLHAGRAAVHAGLWRHHHRAGAGAPAWPLSGFQQRSLGAVLGQLCLGCGPGARIIASHPALARADRPPPRRRGGQLAARPPTEVAGVYPSG